MKLQYSGICDKIRQVTGGEELWQRMMKTKKIITEKRFLSAVDIKGFIDVVCDADESWSDFISRSKKEDPDFRFYESDNAFFMQCAGFEYIWFKKNEQSSDNFEKYMKKAQSF